MELLSWVQQLKSLATHQLSNLTNLNQLSSLQASSIDLNSLFVLAYLLLLANKPTAARLKVSAALFTCIAIGYSPLYDALSQVQFYCLYSLVYITIARYLTNKKIKSTLVIMAVFQLLMAMDSYVNANVETWLYNSFEEVTVLIHILIVSSSADLKPIDLGAILGRFVNSLRGVAHSLCLDPALWYDWSINESTKNNQEARR